MELIYSIFTHFDQFLLGGVTIKLGLLCNVLFLFIINIYLIITHNKEDINNVKVLQSVVGTGGKNIRNILIAVGALGANLSAFITIKNEIKDQKIGKLEKVREEILKAIEADKKEYGLIQQKMEKVREELNHLQIEKVKIFAHNDRLSILDQAINKDISVFKEKSILPDTRLSELYGLNDNILRNLEKFNKESQSIITLFEKEEIVSSSPNDLSENNSACPLSGATQAGEVISKNINNSSIFNFDFTMEWFESLRGIQKLAVGLILGKSVILSALISIIFIFYGNILIEKYDLENKYPRLSKIIKLRQKYQKYYFKLSCFLIFIIVISELILGFSLLLL
jgi:hypothetical protein